MAFINWFGLHWFTLLQTIGIIGSLLLTAGSLRIDAKVRRVSNLIALTHEHRDIWTQLYKVPDLWRVLDPKANLKQVAATPEEEMFVNFLILHLGSVHVAMEDGMFVSIPGLRKDIRQFFSSPIPSLIWDKMKPLQSREFVEFIEECRSEGWDGKR